MSSNRRIVCLVFAALLVACGSSSPPAPADGGAPALDGGSDLDGGSAEDGGPVLDGGNGDGGVIDKAAQCASTFGNALTSSFGRLDGTALAVVKPSDTQCTLPNNDHVVVQITTNGAVYRMVVNVLSSIGPDVNVRLAEVQAALPGPAWQEGWHPGLSFDYPTALSVHANQSPFTPYVMNDLVNRINDLIQIGEPISVLATSSGNPSSTHLVHRNNGFDGAIILQPTSVQPTLLLFHFADQTF